MCQEVDVSGSTVNRLRHQLKFDFRPPKVRQKLNEAQIAYRMQFFKSILFSPLDLSSVFSLMSRVSHWADNRLLWTQRGETRRDDWWCLRNCREFTQGVMVWAAIGVRYRSPLIMIRNSINGPVYQKMLDGTNIFRQLHAEVRPFVGSCAEMESVRKENCYEPGTRICDQIAANVRQNPGPSHFKKSFWFYEIISFETRCSEMTIDFIWKGLKSDPGFLRGFAKLLPSICLTLLFSSFH
jgi:hypothetical protein